MPKEICGPPAVRSASTIRRPASTRTSWKCRRPTASLSIKTATSGFACCKKDGKIGRIDAKTEKVTQWSPPTQGTPQRLAIDSDGIVWFGERTGNKIGRFDPKTETFKEYPLPGPAATPYAIIVGKDNGDLVRLDGSGFDRTPGSEDRKSDRISIPAFRSHDARVFPRCSGPHLVRHAHE